MITQVIKWPFLVIAVMVCGVLGLLVFLVADSGGRGTDTVIKESVSPDGEFIAEIHQIITAMHGGHDAVQVTLKQRNGGPGIVVFSRTYECTSDYSAYRLRWATTKNLTVVYGACDSGRWHSEDENDVQQRSTEANGINISYENSGYTAHAKP